MAFTEKQEYKIEVIGPWQHVQVRTNNIVLKDGVQVGQNYSRTAFQPGRLDDSDNFIVSDVSDQPSEVQAVCNAVWTQKVKDDYKDYLIANKSGG